MSDKKFTLGVDVGGTKTAYGLFESSGELVLQRRHISNAELSPERFFDEIAQNIISIIDEAKIEQTVFSGIGVVLPSFINTGDGLVIKTANLPNIKSFYAQKHLEKALPEYKISVWNDNHAAAITEHRYGAGRGYDNMLYCLMSTGIASGIIINGKLYGGSRGYAGESGHIIVTPDEGMMCGCGNRGCVSTYASGAFIAEHVKNWIAAGEASIIPELAGKNAISAEYIDEAYQIGDALAIRAINQMVTYCAVWLYNLYVTLNIDCFVFGGGLLKMKTPILSMVKEKFDTFSSDIPKVTFKATEFGEDFGIFSASCLPYLT